jgi:selenocysteine lyase/cysteine desulfurase
MPPPPYSTNAPDEFADADATPSLAFYNTFEEVDALIHALHLLPKP